MNYKIITQYQTHQELTNKNSPTEVNRQLRKMETPRNQSTTKQPKTNTITRTKGKCRKLQENCEQ